MTTAMRAGCWLPSSATMYGDAAWVTSGKDALAFVDANPVDLVILDVMMPEMDGLEVLRRLRLKPTTANLPVVMFSAVNDPEFRRRAFDSGASEFWLKASLDFRYLKDHLQRLLVPPKSNPKEPPN